MVFTCIKNIIPNLSLYLIDLDPWLAWKNRQLNHSTVSSLTKKVWKGARIYHWFFSIILLKLPINAQDIQKVNELSAQDFVPRATTALLDAIGVSIDEVETRSGDARSEGKDVKVIFAIFTDGYENDSSKYSWRDISRMISIEPRGGGNFFFLRLMKMPLRPLLT